MFLFAFLCTLFLQFSLYMTFIYNEERSIVCISPNQPVECVGKFRKPVFEYVLDNYCYVAYVRIIMSSKQSKLTLNLTF